MDTLGHDSTRTRARSKSPVSDKRGPLDSKDYTLGIALFLVVVLLWTISGFVTQVSLSTVQIYSKF